MELLKDTMEFEKYVGESISTIMLKEEYIVPDSHPDVENIIFVDAQPTITSKEVMKDKLYVEGEIKYSVMYLSELDEVKEGFNLTYNSKFNGYVDIMGVDPEMDGDAEAIIDYLECRIMNERKVCVEGVLNLEGSVKAKEKFQYITGLSEVKDTQLLKDPVIVDKNLGERYCDLEVKSQILVPIDKAQVGEVAKSDININKKSVKMVEDKIVVDGLCKIKILYKSKEDKEFFSIEHEVMISGEADFEGVEGEMLSSTDIILKSSNVDVSDDDLGETRVIDVTATFEAKTSVVVKQSVEVIDDAYSPNVSLNLVKKPYDINVVYTNKSSESIVKDNIEIPKEMPIPVQCLLTTGKPIVTEKKIIDDKCIVEGVIKTAVIYTSNDESQYVSCLEDEVSFSVTVDTPGSKLGMAAVVKINIETIDGSIEANTIAVKAVLLADVTIKHMLHKEFIDDIEINEEGQGEKKASVIIYVVQEGDTLWKVAKKYFTTVERLAEVNELDSAEIIKKGSKLIIEGRAII